MKKLIIPIIIIIAIFLIVFGATAFVNYYTVAMEQLINRQQAVIIAQDRELTYLANVFYIQCVYTEFLSAKLEDNNIEIMNYKDFCNEYLFPYSELENENYLYDNELSLNVLLRKLELYSDIEGGSYGK